MDCFLSCFKREKASTLIGELVDTTRKGTLRTLLADKIKRNLISPDDTAIIQPNCYEDNSIKQEGNVYGEDGFKAYTYSQLEEIVHRMAFVIKKKVNAYAWSIKNRDSDVVIAFCLPSTLQMIATVLAILELNCSYLAVDAMCAEEQLSQIVCDIQPLLIIIEPHASILSRYNFMRSSKAPPVVSIEILWGEAMSLRPDSFSNITPLNPQNPDHVITAICYTSGHTALPKPVRIAHPTIFNRLVWQWKTFPYEDDDIASLVSRPTSIGFIPELFAPLLVGIPIFILHRYSKPKAEALIAAINQTKLTHITVSPVLLNSIVGLIEKAANPNKMRLKLSSVKIWCCRGDVLTYDLAERFFRNLGLGPRPRRLKIPKIPEKTVSLFSVVSKPSHWDMAPTLAVSESADLPEKRDSVDIQEVYTNAILVNMYGSAEMTSDVIYEVFKDLRDLLSKSKNYRVPLGRPIFNTNVCILDQDEPEILNMGERGEICIAGLSVSSGYISRLDSTMGEFVEKIFPKNIQYRFGHRNDDICTVDICNDGIPRVFFNTRCPVVAKFRGKTIRVDKIEKVIRESGLTDRVEMFVYSPGRFNQTIIAAVELKKDIKPIDVRKVLHRKVQTDVPAEVFHVKQIPMMTDGKTDHRMLLQKYRKYRLVTKNRDRTAHTLPTKRFVADVLQQRSIQFVDYKGHSLLVPQEFE